MTAPVFSPSPDSLDDLADRINAAFRTIEDHRVRVGLLLIEARARVEASGQQWTGWVVANIARSVRDVQRCMALARADDPVAAAAAERGKARAAMAARRAAEAQATNVSRPADGVDLSGISARIGKHPVDLSQLSPSAQAQITQELGLDAPNRSAPSKHRYWVTPPAWMAELEEKYHFDFDPCPHPRPEGFDGLAVEWGQRNWCNPQFTESFSPWIQKAWQECQNGKTTVMVIPLYKNGDIARLTVAGAEIIYAGIPEWLAIEDGTPSPVPPQQRQPCVLAVFRPKTQDTNLAEDDAEELPSTSADKVKAKVAEISGRIIDDLRVKIALAEADKVRLMAENAFLRARVARA